LCDGQILPINQNQSLYSLLGTTYGGDGATSFALPDLRSRTPIHVGDGRTEGDTVGEETHALSLAEMPQHGHAAAASGAVATEPAPTGAGNEVLATAGAPVYQDAVDLTAMGGESIGGVGTGQAHENMQPFITLNFCIALQGLFPSRN
jgi:microcystin-dependent protein